MSNELATLDTNQWEVMKQQAGMLVKTGFLPSEIKSAEQAVAIMLKGMELGIPPMYALSNIVVIKGKPSCDAALMLSLIYRDHGDDAAKWDDDATNEKIATLLYKRRGWAEYKRHTFTIQDAERAGLANGDTWKKYPGALLRARCISAVARMAFPDSIGGMYTPEELGASIVEQVEERRAPVSSYVPDDLPAIDVDGEVVDHDTGEIVRDERPMSEVEEEYYAALLAAESTDKLDELGRRIAKGNITHPTVLAAGRTRRAELEQETRQPELVGAAAGEAGLDRHSS
jgi:hypothetical protein